MRRLSTFMAAATAAMASGLGPASAEKLVWNHNLFGPPRAVTVGIETVRDVLEKASNGNFELKLAYGSALGPEKQTPEAIKSGGYEGGMICAGYYPAKFPLLSVLELPFIAPSDTAVHAKIYQAVIHHPLIVKEMAERWGVRYLGPIVLPPYEFMGNKRIASVADMKGVKMRISGLNAKALQAFGAVPTMVTAPEAYTALERGTIDSFGFPYAYTFGAYKLYEVSKYVTEGMAMGGFNCFQGVSIKAWDKLPKDLQAKLPEAEKLAVDNLLKAYKKADAKWIPIFKQKLEITQFPAAERAKLAAGASKIWEEWVKEQEAAGRPGREMLNFVKAESAKYEKSQGH
jgi:TRAP-type C4-dicarboxylate transport system substrate-binding protein